MLKRLSPYALLGLAAVALAAQDAVLLRRELKPEATDVYAMSMKLNQIINLPTGEMPVDMTSTAKVTFKTGKLDPEKGAELEMVTSDMAFKVDGPMAGMMGDPAQNMPKETVAKGNIDARNRITNMKAQGANAQMMMMGASSLTSFGTFIEFPDKAVKIGDSWEIVLPKSPLTGNVEAKFIGKLVSEKVHGDRPVWVLTMEGKMPIKLDMSQMLKDNPEMAGGMPIQNMTISGEVDMKSEALVDKASGKTLVIETKMDSKQKVDIVDMGMAIDIAGKGVIKLESK